TLGYRRVLHDIVGDLPVIDHVLPLLHLHRRHRGHGLDALDIDLRQLLDEGQYGVQFTLQMRNFGVPDRDPRQMRDTAYGGGINRHYIWPRNGIFSVSSAYSRGRFCTATGAMAPDPPFSPRAGSSAPKRRRPAWHLGPPPTRCQRAATDC